MKIGDNRGSENGLRLRELSAPEELLECQELQRETWGRDFSELVPYSLLLVATKTGGILAGAVDAEDRLQGFVFGLTGFRDGRPLHWSHMLAVRSEARGRGLGRRLKFFQRDLLLSRGVEAAYWTFDPLVATNANLNLNLLGAEVVDYVADMYGRSTGSPLHGGLATDRLVVRWRLASDRVCRLAERGGAGRVELEAEGEGDRRGVIDENANTVRIEIPWTLDPLLKSDPEGLAEWRRRTREAFQRAFDRGYRVVEIHRERPRPGRAGRCFYVLSRAA